MIPCLATIYDRNAEYLGTSVTKLMDNAGKAAFRVLTRKYKLTGKKVQIFCSSGNNGGDGFALGAELLKIKVEVEIVLAVPEGKIRTAAAQYHFARLPKSIIQRYSPKIKIGGDLLVDALLGVGVVGKLKSPLGSIVQRLKKARGRLISLDVPTGGLKPELVIAFHCSKLEKSPQPLFCKGWPYREVVVPIGIPAKAETHFGPGDVQAYFPIRKTDSHKGENGQIAVVGGSATYLGAPIFTALGAVGGGADLVDLFVPAVNFIAARKFSPNVLVAKLNCEEKRLTPAAVPSILKFIQKTGSALVLGPGLGKHADTRKAVIELVREIRTPLVLDADAILPAQSLFSTRTTNTNTILTPHAGEFRRLTGEKASAKAAKKWARKLGVTILLKGMIGVIAAPDGRVRFNSAGSPLLTTGGTGDTLAGLVGSLLARGVKPFEAAGLAAFITGYTAGELALKYESLTPQLLARTFPKTIRQLLNYHGQKD